MANIEIREKVKPMRRKGNVLSQMAELCVP